MSLLAEQIVGRLVLIISSTHNAIFTALYEIFFGRWLHFNLGIWFWFECSHCFWWKSVRMKLKRFSITWFQIRTDFKYNIKFKWGQCNLIRNFKILERYQKHMIKKICKFNTALINSIILQAHNLPHALVHDNGKSAPLFPCLSNIYPWTAVLHINYLKSDRSKFTTIFFRSFVPISNSLVALCHMLPISTRYTKQKTKAQAQKKMCNSIRPRHFMVVHLLGHVSTKLDQRKYANKLFFPLFLHSFVHLVRRSVGFFFCVRSFIFSNFRLQIHN